MYSIFEIFSVGIGPSSSHTVGPMKAAKCFITQLHANQQLNRVTQIRCELFGSLGSTGIGHGTGSAIVFGLMGLTPDTFKTEQANDLIKQLKQSKILNLNQQQTIEFRLTEDIIYHQNKYLAGHSNALQLQAINANNQIIQDEIYYSIGGGVIVKEADYNPSKADTKTPHLPYPYHCFTELKQHCINNKLSITELMLRNQSYWQKPTSIAARLFDLWQIMQRCVERGLTAKGVLPGGLNVQRRAPALYNKLIQANSPDPLAAMDWVNVFALAASEENAAGGQVITAPTNGAAGVIPAVLCYYNQFIVSITPNIAITFFTHAAAIASLYKRNASISGAEVGCQGEVGVASSMAAGALTALMGGNIAQIENAAEIAMEHHLGMTCDPIAGLVQIPCIERNAMGAIKAINASRMALKADYEPKVSLDKVIDTMLATGKDMQNKYKETAQGGLAIHITNC